MANTFPSVYCNLVAGPQKAFSFCGGSKIVNAYSVVTTEALLHEEDFVVREADLDEAMHMRRHWLLVRERKPAVFAPLTATAR